MRLLAHRGLWHDKPAQNTPPAFKAALARGYGIETDIRDQDGALVVAHDMPAGRHMPLADLLALCGDAPPASVLAINIKADGLADDVARALAGHPGLAAFVFDMSVPDTLAYLRRGMRVFARMSEYEADGPLVSLAAGVWLDAFHSDWWSLDLLRALLVRGQEIAIVSPELHGRPHQETWQALKTLGAGFLARCLLCTDHPDAAAAVFAD